MEKYLIGVATSVIAVLGKRGSGKTYFAGVLEEELAENGIPFIVLRPYAGTLYDKREVQGSNTRWR